MSLVKCPKCNELLQCKLVAYDAVSDELPSMNEAEDDLVVKLAEAESRIAELEEEIKDLESTMDDEGAADDDIIDLKDEIANFKELLGDEHSAQAPELLDLLANYLGIQRVNHPRLKAGA
jgi:archaellum component FlaC